MIGCIIFLALSIGSFVISYFQFKGKGFLLNNAYLWADQEERERMGEEEADKKPYYRQSGLIFVLAGIMFLMMVAYIATDWVWMFAAFVLAGIITIVYAIVSSVKMEQHK